MYKHILLLMFVSFLVACSSSSTIQVTPPPITSLTVTPEFVPTEKPIVESLSPISDILSWGEIYVTLLSTQPPFFYKLGVLQTECLLPQKQVYCQPIQIYSSFPNDLNPVSGQILNWAPDGDEALMLNNNQIFSFNPQNYSFMLVSPVLIADDRFKWSADSVWFIATTQDADSYNNSMLLFNVKNGEKRYLDFDLSGTYLPLGWATATELVFLNLQYQSDNAGGKQYLKMAYLYKFNIQTQTKTLLGENMIWAAYPPVLSPDGFSIIFLAEQNGTRELMMMKSDGTNIQALGEYGDGAIWSPDGQWIATGRTTSDLRSIVYLVSPDGGDGHIVFEGEKELLGINWLPDSQYLLITTYDIETDGRFLFLVFIEDGTFQPVTIPGIDPNQYVVQGISLRPLPSAP